MKLVFRLNGKDKVVETSPDRRGIDLLREDLGLTGTKEACGAGDCGACAILIDGESRLSCLTLAAQFQDRDITTVEGLGEDPVSHGARNAFVEEGAVQCGFCSPGMIISSIDLLNRQQNPSREQIRNGISGNLCRCGGYNKIVDAVTKASEIIAKGEKD